MAAIFATLVASGISDRAAGFSFVVGCSSTRSPVISIPRIPTQKSARKKPARRTRSMKTSAAGKSSRNG